MKELLSKRALACQLITPYRYESGGFIVEQSLTDPGLEIARKKQEMPVPYEEIEPEEPEVRRTIIINTIRKLNELPFLATTACCQGHLKKSNGEGQFDENLGYLWGGWLSFLFDPRLPSSEQFFNRLGSLTRQYSYVGLRLEDAQEWGGFELPLSNNKYGLPSCVIEFGLSDFSTDGRPIPSTKGVTVPRHLGQQRVESYDQFWQTLSAITCE